MYLFNGGYYYGICYFWWMLKLRNMRIRVPGRRYLHGRRSLCNRRWCLPWLRNMRWRLPGRSYFRRLKQNSSEKEKRRIDFVSFFVFMIGEEIFSRTAAKAVSSKASRRRIARPRIKRRDRMAVRSLTFIKGRSSVSRRIMKKKKVIGSWYQQSIALQYLS